MGRRLVTATALLVGLLALGTGPAGAAGGRLAPVSDSYEPGEVATLVGYTSGPLPEQPFYAYLQPAGGVADWYVGELVVEETPHAGYLALRVSVRFEVPAELEPGDYEVVYCDDPCTGAPLGDLVASPLSIGVDPARRVVREWARDEPEVANLAGDALLVGPGFATTAAEVRAPAPVAVAAPVTVPASVPPPSIQRPAPAPVPAAAAADAMDWPLPTALVLGAGAGTWLALAYRQRRLERRRPRPGMSRATSPTTSARLWAATRWRA